MKKKVRLSRPGYKKGGAPSIAEQNETIDSISSGKRNVFLDRISNAAQEQMMNQAMMEAEEQFVPPGLYNYGGVPIYNVGGSFGFAMNPQAMANQSMYANALTDANTNLNNTDWLGDFANVNLGESTQMNIEANNPEAKKWYKDYSKGFRKEERKKNKEARQAYWNNAYGGTPNYYNDGGAYNYYEHGGPGPHGTQGFDDYEKWGNNSDVDAAVAPFYKSAWNDMWGNDMSMSRRAQDIRNTPGANVAANIGGNGSTEGLTMWEVDKLKRAAAAAGAAAGVPAPNVAPGTKPWDMFDFNTSNGDVDPADSESTQDILNNTQSMIEGVDPRAAAQRTAQNIADSARDIAGRSRDRTAALNVETTTTNVDDALKGKTKKTKTASTASTDDDGSTTAAAADETADERDLEGSIGADDVNGTSNTGTDAQGIQGNWLKAKGFRGAPVFMPIPSMNGQAGLTPGWDYEETRGGFMTPFKKQRRWSYNPQTGQNEPVSEAGDGMNQSGPNFNPELNVSNNQNQNVDYFGEKRTLGERARNMRNRFRRNEEFGGFEGNPETDVMLPGGMGAASEQGNMQFTNREPSAQYENPVPDYNTGYNQKQDDPNYIPEGGVSGPNNEYGEGWTQAEIDDFRKRETEQRYGGVPNYFQGGVPHELFDQQQIANQLKTEEALNNAYSLRKQYGGVVQELTQPEIDQILAMGGKVEYLD